MATSKQLIFLKINFMYIWKMLGKFYNKKHIIEYYIPVEIFNTEENIISK